MSWSAQQSSGRIQKHLQSMQPIDISDLTKEMNLEAVVSEVQCKRICGAHIYASMPRFTQLAFSYSDDASSRELMVAVHLYQQEVFRIVEQVFQGYQVHFQGPKLHAVLYQPFHDEQKIAACAVLLQLALEDFVQTVFRPLFPRLKIRGLTSGADFGKTIATSNGLKNDREMLFIGSAANYAAKILADDEQNARITYNLYQLLPQALKKLCTPIVSKISSTQVYQVQRPERAAFLQLLRDYKISWDIEESKRQLHVKKDQFSRQSILIREECSFKDIANLSIKNSRRIMAASLFADVSGFTHYIEQAEKNLKKQKKALRIFHVIREEMAQIVRQDFQGIRVQFQGDRVQALFAGDEHTIAHKAVQAAIGLQSSMEAVIPSLLPQASELHLAIGIDLGTTLISRLGVRKYRDPIYLGLAVEHATQFEEGCNGKQITISRRVRKALSPALQSHFQLNQKLHCYTATGIIFAHTSNT